MASVSESKASYNPAELAEDIVVPVKSSIIGNHADVTDLIEDGDELRFRLSNVNVSLANAIRRTILTDIPTVVFRTTPYEKNEADIKVNTSGLNNEILKQRLSCIPIHITDDVESIKELVVVIHKKNETNEVVNITTKDFQVINTTTGTPISDEKRDEIFPMNKQTREHILFARLRPKIGDSIPGEEIHIEAKMTVDTARENSSYNVVSTCSYRFTPDTAAAEKQWEGIRKSLTGTDMTEEDIAKEEKNFYLGPARRIFKKDSFDFVVETVGVFDNKTLVRRACDIMIMKCDSMSENVRGKSLRMSQSMTTMENTYDITLENDHYSYGKSLEFALYRMFYQSSGELSFVGFNKDHPYDDDSILRVGFVKPTDVDNIYRKIQEANTYIRSVFERIREQFGDS